MSIDIRYLTNNTDKTVYRVIDSSAGTFAVYESIEEIPKAIRHYAPKKPTFCMPDLARMFGVIDVLYPNFPKCGHPSYRGHACIAESCRIRGCRHWALCPHYGAIL